MWRLLVLAGACWRLGVPRYAGEESLLLWDGGAELHEVDGNQGLERRVAERILRARARARAHRAALCARASARTERCAAGTSAGSEPSVVLYRFFQSHQTRYLAQYLVELHKRGYANTDHTKLLFTPFSLHEQRARLCNFIGYLREAKVSDAAARGASGPRPAQPSR
jgi:hypothetical protein